MSTTNSTAASELRIHIEAINAKSQAWVAESPTTRGAFVLVADPAYWAEMGIHSVAEFVKAMRSIEEDAAMDDLIYS